MPFPQGCERVEIAKGTAGGTPPPSFTLQSTKRAALHPCEYNGGSHIKVAPVQIPPSLLAYGNEQWTQSLARIGE